MKEWWHKIRGYESFRVKYSTFTEGLISRKMSYKHAKLYASAVAGKVLFDPDIFYESPGGNIL